MQQTTERPTAPARQGFLRRLLSRRDGAPTTPDGDSDGTALAPHTVIDLRDDLSATQWRLAVSERIERLETGMFLVAETMKRAFGQVYQSIEDLRAEGSAPNGRLEMILDESVSSLKAAVEDLSEAIHRVPYILAAAADDVTAQLEAASPGTGQEPASPPAIPPAREPRAPAEILPATPFELEPVEEQFVPMDEDPDALDARKIWGLEA